MSDEPNYFQDIADFHAAMGLPLMGLTGDAFVENMKVRKRLVDEELLGEFFPAYAKYSRDPSIDHLVELIDAICDSIYVVGGTQIVLRNDAVSWGLSSCGYPMNAILSAAGDVYFMAFRESDTELDHCAALCDRLYSYGNSLIGEDKFNACWREVHRTNMAKAAGPVVNGKKMKPEGWKPPRLKEIINQEPGWETFFPEDGGTWPNTYQVKTWHDRDWFTPPVLNSGAIFVSPSIDWGGITYRKPIGPGLKTPTEGGTHE